jgi:hypothetical protein
MPRLGVRLGSVALRNPDLETARSRVFHFAERACARAGQNQRHPANGQAVYVGDGISIRLAQDRQRAANQSYYRNCLAPRLREAQARGARREWSPCKHHPGARFRQHLWRFL